MFQNIQKFVYLTVLFNISAGTFSEAVLEEVKEHPNAEFVVEDSGQSDKFEVATQLVNSYESFIGPTNETFEPDSLAFRWPRG
jgi:hypothetical protein